MITERWEIDSSHSSVHFSVRHLVIATVRGHFTRWSATLVAPDGDFARASVEATIDASSIDTGVADRDAHLKSPDFLDVAQYPEIRFTTARVEKEGNDLRLAGRLTIKGITRDVVFRNIVFEERRRPGNTNNGATDAAAGLIDLNTADVPGVVSGLTFENISLDQLLPDEGQIIGARASPVEGVTFRNVRTPNGVISNIAGLHIRTNRYVSNVKIIPGGAS